MPGLDRRPTGSLPAGIEIRPLGVDDFPAVRYLHATVLRAETGDALTEAEIAAFAGLVNSPAYSDLLREENEIFSAWLGGELLGTAAWRINADDGTQARIGYVFARHRGFGIGSRLLAEAELDPDRQRNQHHQADRPGMNPEERESGDGHDHADRDPEVALDGRIDRLRDRQLHQQDGAERRKVRMIVAGNQCGQLPGETGRQRRLEDTLAQSEPPHLPDQLRQQQVGLGSRSRSRRYPVQRRYPRVIPAITTFVIIIKRSCHAS